MADQWRADFYSNNVLFDDISAVASTFSDYKVWPDLNDYNALLKHLVGDICSPSGIPLKFIPQADKSHKQHDNYEARIYLKGEIQTRLQNWHDFFQVMVWSTYPLCKQLINKIHFEAYTKRRNSHQRTTVENSLTLFDECGVIIVSQDKQLLELVQKFKWQQLFIENRHAFNRTIKCFTFGHALLEKFLNPYIGMTAHCIFLEVDDGLFDLCLSDQQKQIDKLAASYFKEHNNISPRELHPFPLLGIPGWDSRNENPAYYQNTDYFRTGRRNAS